MIELRYVYDCESMDKKLEYRQMENGQAVSAWMAVPMVFPKAGDYTTPKKEDEQIVRNLF